MSQAKRDAPLPWVGDEVPRRVASVTKGFRSATGLEGGGRGKRNTAIRWIGQNIWNRCNNTAEPTGSREHQRLQEGGLHEKNEGDVTITYKEGTACVRSTQRHRQTDISRNRPNDGGCKKKARNEGQKVETRGPKGV